MVTVSETRPESTKKLAALTRIATTVREADLARLASASGRLNAGLEARTELETALQRQIHMTIAEPELPMLHALDQHVLLAEQARSALDRRVAVLAAEREAERVIAARSFGRAQVLERLCAKARSRTGTGRG